MRRALCGLALLLATTAAAPAGPAPELILRNGAIDTIDAAQPHATALAIEGGRILAVGSDAAIAKLGGPQTEAIDLHGRFVLPGFIDAHTHLISGGTYLSAVRLRDARTLAEVQRRVADYAKAHPGPGWIIGEAFSYGYPDMPGGAPTKEMLDAVAPDRPVLLNSGMAHAAWVNSKALALAGIDRATPDPPDGTYVRDKAGNPTGWLKEFADRAVLKAIPPDAKPGPQALIEANMAEASRLGVTRMVSAGFDFELLPVLSEMEAKGELKTRFSIAAVAKPESFGPDFVRTIEAARARYHDDWVAAGAVKFFEDGVIESHTAYLPQGYADLPKVTGTDFWTPARQRQAVVTLNRLGFQVYTHAIGDGAIHQTLDAYEAAAKAGAPPDLRNRIEHFEAPYAADIARLARLGVIASMQPAMIYPKDQWMGMAGLWTRYAGAERARRAFPIRSVLAAGGHIAFGTDWPICDLNPLFGIRNAVLRQSLDGEPAGGWVPAERIALAQAIEGYTLDAAYAAHRDKDEGSLSPGKLADLIVLDRDLTKLDPAQFAAVKVLATMVGGRVVYGSLPAIGTSPRFR